MAGNSVTFTGTKEMSDRLKVLANRFPDAIDQALYIETQGMLKEVIKRTPVDKGSLRASEHVEGPTRQGKTTYTKIVAGGPSAPYAIYVHENLTAHHTVGQAKFIESVILENVSSLGSRLAKRLKLNGIS